MLITSIIDPKICVLRFHIYIIIYISLYIYIIICIYIFKYIYIKIYIYLWTVRVFIQWGMTPWDCQDHQIPLVFQRKKISQDPILNLAENWAKSTVQLLFLSWDTNGIS